MKNAQEKQGYRVKKRRANLTQERVKALFDYREDGLLIRRVRTARRTQEGDIAGCVDSLGYREICIDSVKYRLHRIVWLWHHGYLPEHGLDHINRNRADSRIENLREATQSCNMRNTGNPSNSTSGIKGVSRCKQKWRAHIKVGGRTISLGWHHDFPEAVCHRLAAEQAEGWPDCDSSSPAFQYVEKHIIR